MLNEIFNTYAELANFAQTRTGKQKWMAAILDFEVGCKIFSENTTFRGHSTEKTKFTSTLHDKQCTSYRIRFSNDTISVKFLGWDHHKTLTSLVHSTKPTYFPEISLILIASLHLIHPALEVLLHIHVRLLKIKIIIQ